MTTHSARAIQWDMQGFLKQCLDVYRQLAGPTAPHFRRLVTAFIDQKAEEPGDLANTGALAPVASKILMKVLYAARMARPDLLRATCYLATRITKWTAQCDKMLYRLMCYIYSTSMPCCMDGWETSRRTSSSVSTLTPILLAIPTTPAVHREYSCVCVAQTPLFPSGPPASGRHVCLTRRLAPVVGGRQRGYPDNDNW